MSGLWGGWSDCHVCRLGRRSHRQRLPGWPRMCVSGPEPGCPQPRRGRHPEPLGIGVGLDQDRPAQIGSLGVQHIEHGNSRDIRGDRRLTELTQLVQHAQRVDASPQRVGAWRQLDLVQRVGGIGRLAPLGPRFGRSRRGGSLLLTHRPRLATSRSWLGRLASLPVCLGTA